MSPVGNINILFLGCCVFTVVFSQLAEKTRTADRDGQNREGYPREMGHFSGAVGDYRLNKSKVWTAAGEVSQSWLFSVTFFWSENLFPLGVSAR